MLAALADVRCGVRTTRAAFDPAGTPAEGEPADRALLDPEPAPVLRAAALRPALQVAPEPQHRDPSFDASSFSKNRERLLSAEHFTRDSSLLEAWSSVKSYRPRDEEDGPRGGGRNPEVDFRGRRRSRETRISRTDPEARLFRKATHPSVSAGPTRSRASRRTHAPRTRNSLRSRATERPSGHSHRRM